MPEDQAIVATYTAWGPKALQTLRRELSGARLKFPFADDTFGIAARTVNGVGGGAGGYRQKFLVNYH